MKLSLPPELRQAVSESGVPVELHDDATNRDFYLVPAAQYEKLKRFVESGQIDPSLYEFTEIEMHGTNDE